MNIPMLMKMVQIMVMMLLVAPELHHSFNTDPLDPSQSWYQPFDRVPCNYSAMENGAQYAMATMYIAWRAMSSAGGKNVAYGKQVLARQTDDESTPPYRWLMLELHGRGGDTAMFAVRQDNLYVVGFADKTGRWYVFRNRAALIPGATVLDSEDSYAGLVGHGGYQNLASLRLGRESTLRAVAQLSGYQHDVQADNGCLRRAVAILVVTINEAARFVHIGSRIGDSWVTGADLRAQRFLVVNWKTISCALMVSRQRGGTWEGPEVNKLRNVLGINTLAEAAAAVNVLIWPKDEKCSDLITWLKA